MQKFISAKRGMFPAFALFAIAVFLVWKNFTPGTWLTGWDTLHPEFNFLLNFKRLIFGVWREEQGLGALATHAHIADLPRIFLLWVVSFVAPLDSLRYFYFFLALILGPLGVYFFIKFTSEESQNIFQVCRRRNTTWKVKSELDLPPFKVFKKDLLPREAAAFFGGLFYLLNLGTLQHFYVPFEMFAAQYAFLPWLFLFAIKYLTEGGRRNLIIFSFLTFLATPMAYAATLWYVYFAALIIFATASFLIISRTFITVRRVLTVLVLTLAINAFWLLPQIYFVATGSAEVSQAKINQLFSEKAFAHDLKYATLENAALLKGFLFDWQEYDGEKFVFLLDEWRLHLENPLTLSLGYFLFGLVVLGILISISRKEKFGLALLPLFLFSSVFLIYAAPPLDYLLAVLRENSTLFRESFRFPWTKFSILAMFGYSFYFSQAVLSLLEWLKERKIIFLASLFLIPTSLFIFMAPAFSGHFISPSMRRSIPNDYFKIFSFFKDKPIASRIGVFPTPTMWGWDYYDWGFEGAGFVWFGLPQPVLVRDFDRWSPTNENFYWEASHAFYSHNLPLFEKVLEKYQVSYLFFDGHLINPAWPKALYGKEFEEFLASTEKVTLLENFGEMRIYQIRLETPTNNSIFLAQNLPNSQPTYKWNNYDRAYIEDGNYVSHQPLATSHQLIYYPFRSLFTGKNQEDLEFKVKEEEDFHLFSQTLPPYVRGYTPMTLEVIPEELMWVDPQDLSQVRYLQPEVHYDGDTVTVRVPKVGGYFSAEIDPVQVPEIQRAKNCDRFYRGTVENEQIIQDGQKFLRLNATDANNCSVSIWLPNLSHQMAYLITAESRNLSGRPLLFWVENLTINRADTESYLPKSAKLVKSYFIQPPMENDGLGYSLHFDNISIGQVEAVNDLGKVTVNPIPYSFLTGLKLVGPESGIKNLQLIEPEKVENPNPSFYRVQLPTIQQFNNSTILVLSQSYHEGWKAYEMSNVKCQMSNKITSLKCKISNYLPFVFGKEIKDHVLVNNWENGWQIDNSTMEQSSNAVIVILFWPQYLEYLGFAILILVPLGLWRWAS